MAKMMKKAPAKNTTAKAAPKSSAKTSSKAAPKKAAPAVKAKAPVKKAAPAKKPTTMAAKAPAKKSTGSTGKTSSAGSQMTIDHDEIRNWAEARGGKPSCVMGTGGKGDTGVLRLEFPGKPNANDDSLSEISWDEFFEKFDANELALLYQDHTAGGKQSNFNKLINRNTAMLPKKKS